MNVTSVNSETTENKTSPNQETTQVTSVDVLIATLCIALASFICSLNVLTILVVWRTPALRTFTVAYVVSLAVADFMVGLELLPMSLYFLPPTRVGLFNRNVHMCLLMNGLSTGMTTVSLMHMLVISVDRYIYIVRPYYYEQVMSSRLVSALIASSWAIGVLLLFMPHVIHKDGSKAETCEITKLLPTWHLFTAIWTMYFSVSLVIFVMYSLIFLTALKQRNAVRVTAAAVETHTGPHSQVSSATVGNHRGFYFFLTLFGVFFLCLTPVVVAMGLDCFVPIPVTLYRFLVMLAMANSGMNFIIFAFQNKEFRGALIKLLNLKRFLPNNSTRDVLQIS
uniref:G-protein coupled receptors family 1 profile domain-containing protein n=1 Tax=Biomphalaria glabrata TaxID=6526 RepID=A0A2C9KZ95_BIOGL